VGDKGANHPQLIFSVDGQSLVVELKVFSEEVNDLMDLYRKIVSREELFEILTEIRGLGIELYPA
jgi:hypothetical protein